MSLSTPAIQGRIQAKAFIIRQKQRSIYERVDGEIIDNPYSWETIAEYAAEIAANAKYIQKLAQEAAEQEMAKFISAA